MKKVLVVCVLLLSAVIAFPQTDTTTSNVTVTVSNEASILTASAATLTKADTLFGSFTGNSTVTYKIRTSEVGGGGTLKVSVAQFAPATGPTLGATSDLSYGVPTITSGGSGSATAGAAQANVDAATNYTIVQFGTDFHSADAGDQAQIDWTLLDRPTYKTGTYTAVATWTISAT